MLLDERGGRLLEALRILMPSSATGETDWASLIAAIERGLVEYYRRDVGHLRATLKESLEPGQTFRRRYLYLYDGVPGGTGYLKQLMQSADELKRLLELARDVVRDCGCDDGCHACLFSYRLSWRLDRVSRRAALALLDAILARWDKLRSSTEGLDQLKNNAPFESEALFVEALRRGRAADGTPFVVRKDILPNGKAGYYVGAGRGRWYLEPQAWVGPKDNTCRADFLLMPASGAGLRIAVFTDGFEFHRDRIAKDMLQRQAVWRAGDTLVWSLGWNDVQAALADVPETLAPLAGAQPPPVSGGAAGRNDNREPAAVVAYRDGNLILTDGPIGKFSLDANCRFDSDHSELRWHDANCVWENHDGGIGGRGRFDGGLTALAPRGSPDLVINTIWQGRNQFLPSNRVVADDMSLRLQHVTLTHNDRFAIGTGIPGRFRTERLPTLRDTGSSLFPSALIMLGELGAANLQTKSKFFTNPIWTVPVEMKLTAPDICPIPAGELTLEVSFGVSMDPTLRSLFCEQNPHLCVSPPGGVQDESYKGPRIFVSALDGKGESSGRRTHMVERAWSNFRFAEFGRIDNGKLTARSRDEIPCSDEFWDAERHEASPSLAKASYAVIVSDLRDMHANALNAIAATVVLDRTVGGFQEPPPSDDPGLGP